MAEVRRLLVRAPNWLGDAVMALPALEAVRRAFAGRTIVLAALPSIAPIFEERTGAARMIAAVVQLGYQVSLAANDTSTYAGARSRVSRMEQRGEAMVPRAR